MQITHRLGSRVQIVGDDLFVTNPKRIAEGVAMKAANAVLIKPNQIGALTQTIEAVRPGAAGGLPHDPLPPLRRDRGQHHRGHRGGLRRGADQDRRPLPRGADGEVQSASPD